MRPAILALQRGDISAIGLMSHPVTSAACASVGRMFHELRKLGVFQSPAVRIPSYRQMISASPVHLLRAESPDIRHPRE
jgi:hypothetical protein